MGHRGVAWAAIHTHTTSISHPAKPPGKKCKFYVKKKKNNAFCANKLQKSLPGCPAWLYCVPNSPYAGILLPPQPVTLVPIFKIFSLNKIIISSINTTALWSKYHYSHRSRNWSSEDLHDSLESIPWDSRQLVHPPTSRNDGNLNLWPFGFVLFWVFFEIILVHNIASISGVQHYISASV